MRHITKVSFQVQIDLSTSTPRGIHTPRPVGLFAIGNTPDIDLHISDQRVFTYRKTEYNDLRGYEHFFFPQHTRVVAIILIYGFLPELQLTAETPYIDLRSNQRILNQIHMMMIDMIVVSHVSAPSCCNMYNALFPRWHALREHSIPLTPLSWNRCPITPSDSVRSYDGEFSHKVGIPTPGLPNDCTGKVTYQLDELIREYDIQTVVNEQASSCECPMEQDVASGGSSVVVNSNVNVNSFNTITSSSCSANVNINACGHHIVVQGGIVYINGVPYNGSPAQVEPEAIEEDPAPKVFLWQKSFFEDWWLDTIQRYQSDILPVGLIAKDKIKQWFMFLYDSTNARLSTIQCWICNLFYELAMLAPRFRSPLASDGGYLGPSYQANWQTISRHAETPGHVWLIEQMKEENVETIEQFQEIFYMKHTSGELLRAQNNQFKTAHQEAKLGMSYNSHTPLVDLEKECGADMGRLQASKQASKDLRLHMCKKHYENLSAVLLQNESPVGLLLDESVDISGKAELLVYIQTVERNRPIFILYRVIHLRDATAKGIFEAITKAWQEDGLYQYFIDHLRSISTDGASALTGAKGGAVKLISEVCTHEIIPNHCFAHKLNLSCKHGLKGTNHFIYLEKSNNKVYSFYRGNAGHKRYDHLSKTAYELAIFLYTPEKVFQVRWSSSEHSAFYKLYRNWAILVIDLQLMVNDKKTFNADDRRQAHELGQTLKSRRYPLNLAFASDILKVISVWALALQDRNGLLYDKLRERDDVLTKLDLLKQPYTHIGTEESTLSKFMSQVKCWGRAPQVNNLGQSIPGIYIVKEKNTPCFESSVSSSQLLLWLPVPRRHS